MLIENSAPSRTITVPANAAPVPSRAIPVYSLNLHDEIHMRMLAKGLHKKRAMRAMEEVVMSGEPGDYTVFSMQTEVRDFLGSFLKQPTPPGPDLVRTFFVVSSDDRHAALFHINLDGLIVGRRYLFSRDWIESIFEAFGSYLTRTSPSDVFSSC